MTLAAVPRCCQPTALAPCRQACLVPFASAANPGFGESEPGGTRQALGTRAPLRHPRESGGPGRPTPCVRLWTPHLRLKKLKPAGLAPCVLRDSRCAASSE